MFSCTFAVCSHNVLHVYFGFVAGLTTLSLQKERSHQAGRKLAISGSVVAALEPFLLSYSGDEITLWDRQHESILQTTIVGHQVLGFLLAFKDIQAGRVTLVLQIIMFNPLFPTGTNCGQSFTVIFFSNL